VHVYCLEEGTHVVFTGTDGSYLRGDLRVAVRNRGTVFPEGFPPPCPGGKDLCRIHAHDGRPRGVPGNREASAEQYWRRDYNLLSHPNRVAYGSAQRRGNQSFRLGSSPDLALGVLTWMNGIKVVRSGAASQDGVPVGMTFFMGSVILLAGAGDLRMLLSGGVRGAKRIARHLWRMCFGLFIAAGSFFLGPSNRPLRLLSAVGLGQHLSPVLFRTTLYLILTVLPLVMLIFWLLRVRLTNAYKGSLQPASASPDRVR